jgi:sulfonate transport system permease protein
MSKLANPTSIGALIFALSVMLAWQYASDHGLLSPIFVPPPSSIATALADLAISGALWDALGATLARMLGGWTLAAVAGVALGALVGLSARSAAFINPTLEFFRQLPAAVLIPPAILLLGLSEQMMVSVIALGSVWPILLSTIHGFAATDSRLREVAGILEMSTLAYLRKIALPAAMPDILAGVRVSLALALILTVVVEMQAGLPGMGRSILLAQRSFRAPELYAGIAVLGILGFVLNFVALLGERYVLRWRESTP